MTDVSTQGLQRRAEMRLQADWAQEARADPRTQYLVGQGTAVLVSREPSTGVALFGIEQEAIGAIDDSRLVLLGWYRGARCVLVDLPPETPFMPPGTFYEELRPLLPLISAEEAQLLSLARALLIWRSRTRYCGVCGAPTAPRSAGYVLVCTRCNAEFFPRIDPAIIVLVTDGPKALLGRQASWPNGRYSALAGFVEPGESLEDTVAREVEEESGIRVTRVHYFASQPWPFPGSIMVGFHADAQHGAVRLDDELEDARWFSAEEIAASPAALLPAPYTIARRLIDAWYLQVTGRALTVPA
jgi:NAD+ diphosphatase